MASYSTSPAPKPIPSGVQHHNTYLVATPWSQPRPAHNHTISTGFASVFRNSRFEEPGGAAYQRRRQTASTQGNHRLTVPPVIARATEHVCLTTQKGAGAARSDAKHCSRAAPHRQCDTNPLIRAWASVSLALLAKNSKHFSCRKGESSPRTRPVQQIRENNAQ